MDGTSEPKVTLDQLERLRARTRRLSYPSWIPFLVFGILVLGAIPFALAGDHGYDGLYWLAAGPLGGALTWALTSRRGSAIGLLDRRFHLHAAIIAAMVGGALAIGWIGGESSFSEAGTLLPIAAGLIAIGAINRSALVAGAGLAIAAWGLGVLAAEPEEVAAWAYAGEGAILVAAGIASLLGVRASADVHGLRGAAEGGR